MAEPSSKPARVGPGILYFAPLGTAEPASPTASIDAAFKKLGYTEKGSTWGVDLTVQRFYVAEAFEPIIVRVTQRLSHAEFNLAETDPFKVQIALNGDSSTITAVGPFSKFDPPDVGNEVRGMLLWRSAVTPCDEQIVMRQVLQTGNLSTSRTKDGLALINCHFDAELPATGLTAWSRWTLDSAFAA